MNRKIIVLIRLLICILAAVPFSLFAGDNGSSLTHQTAGKANMMIVSLVTTKPTFSNGSFSYMIGGIIAVLLMGYLVYTLLKPEKF
jgi:K+-transporting ATPase KdpF subunit